MSLIQSNIEYISEKALCMRFLMLKEEPFLSPSGKPTAPTRVWIAQNLAMSAKSLAEKIKFWNAVGILEECETEIYTERLEAIRGVRNRILGELPVIVERNITKTGSENWREAADARDFVTKFIAPDINSAAAADQPLRDRFASAGLIEDPLHLVARISEKALGKEEEMESLDGEIFSGVLPHYADAEEEIS